MISKTYISSLILLITLTLFSGCQSDQNGRTMLRIGNKQYQKKQYNDSESSYLKSIEKNKSPEALYGRGNSTQRLSSSLPSDKLSTMDSVSMASYQSALELSGSNVIKKSKIYHNMGNSCYIAGLRNKKTQRLDESNKKFEESIEYYKSSLRLNPSDDETRYNLSLALYMLEKNQEEQKNQEQNQNQDNENQDKDKQNQDKDKQNQDKDKDNKEKQNDSESNKQEKDQKNNQKDNKNNSKDNTQNKNKTNQDSSSSLNRNEKTEGKIDKKTANQLLNAAQQDENKVQKKIEKAIGVGGSYEKDW